MTTLDSLPAIRREIEKSPNDPHPWQVLHEYLSEIGCCHAWQLERLRGMIEQLPVRIDRHDRPSLHVSYCSIWRSRDKRDYYFLQAEDNGKWHVSRPREETEGPARKEVQKGITSGIKPESLIPLAVCHWCGLAWE